MFTGIFLFFAILHIVVRMQGSNLPIDYFSKPIPILMIIIYVFSKKKEWMGWKTFSGKILLGLIFGITGDVLLMSPELFLPGLVSFLIGHIFYIFAFLPGVKLKFLMGAPLLILGASMGYYLSNKTGVMLIPVMLYLIVILTMSWMALCRDKNLPNYSSIVVGSLFFILSDSFLALAKFTGLETGFNTAIIMGTYYLAQYFIGYVGVKKS
ncbi:MAG: lysoplasmalogenase [Spirochaetia bacterium]|nr:lysoplasmalogenase [Spirochaetia bacterium]